MKILFIGDIVGRTGRRCVARRLPALRAEYAFDLVVANIENAAGGLGATPEIVAEMRDLGVDAFTMGNHTWRKRSLIPELEANPAIVRPANYPPGVPGRGAALITLPDGRKVGLLDLIGRVYMEPSECPFAAADVELAKLAAETNIILVDMHAEATSEKVAMGWHLDGRCTAVVGTHTHVQTADAWILPKGTAYITDAGMCGPIHSVIGVEVDRILYKFTTGMPKQFVVARGAAMFCGVIIEADEATGRATGISTIFLRDETPAGA